MSIDTIDIWLDLHHGFTFSCCNSLTTTSAAALTPTTKAISRMWRDVSAETGGGLCDRETSEVLRDSHGGVVKDSVIAVADSRVTTDMLVNLCGHTNKQCGYADACF